MTYWEVNVQVLERGTVPIPAPGSRGVLGFLGDGLLGLAVGGPPGSIVGALLGGVLGASSDFATIEAREE